MRGGSLQRRDGQQPARVDGDATGGRDGLSGRARLHGEILTRRSGGARARRRCIDAKTDATKAPTFYRVARRGDHALSQAIGIGFHRWQPVADLGQNRRG
jgi:hypothetical protein